MFHDRRRLGAIQPKFVSVGGFHAFAVNFNGSTSFTSNAIGGGLNVNSQVLLFSTWVKLSSIPNDAYLIYTGAFFDCGVNTVGNFFVSAYNPSSTIIVNATSSGGLITTGAWHSIVLGLDLTVPRIQLYIDNASISMGTPSSGTINYSGNSAGYKPYGAGGQATTGDVAECYFNIAQTLDLSNVTNLRKIVSATNKPVDLGDGSLPTGSQSLICLNNQSVGTWGTNRNTTAGGLSIAAGALTAASTSPSD